MFFKDRALPGPFPYHGYLCVGKIFVNTDKFRSKKFIVEQAM